MKTIYKKLLFLLLLLPVSVLAQNTLTGTVLEKSSGMPLPGVSVVIQGTTNGTSTDLDGKFTLLNVKNGDKLVFSYIGYNDIVQNYTGQNSVSVSMEEQASELQEVVVQVGYGTVKKKDATGSITTVTSKDFNKGSIVSADQLLTGKAAGVRITNNGGQPDSAPNIRIRGGASLSASNAPLIVIDNIPVDNTIPAGVGNPLSLINPNDIESITVLKDASATAIYGSRASNGVLIITTKRGSSGEIQYNLSSSYSVAKVGKKLPMMDSATFVKFIQEYHPGDPLNPGASLTNLLGVDDPNSTAIDDLSTLDVIEGRILANTDWQDAIFREAITVDHNFSARGSINKGKLPFRASIGHSRNEGIVKTNDYERLSASVKLTPTFLNDHLKVDINAKGIFSKKNEVDEGGAIGGAIGMDPTKPIYDEKNSLFGGYFQNITPTTFTTTGTNLPGVQNRLEGSTNPLALLQQRKHPNTAMRFLGNIELDYKMHFLPELRAVVNVGIDANRAKIKEVFDTNSIATYKFNTSNPNPSTNYLFNPGKNYEENQTMTNTTWDSYLVYAKNLTGFISRFDVQGGYSYQNFKNDGYKENYRYNENTGKREILIDPLNPKNRYYNELNLQSFFGRTNIDLAGKYLMTFSIRADGSSLFREDKRWGYFPAGAIAWRLNQESFLKSVTSINDLKIRLGVGKTGQQDITGQVGFYPSTPLFQLGSNSSQYLSDANLYSAIAFNDKLTWEKTTTYNAGLDFDLFKGSYLTGSFDIYRRVTTDLLARVALPPGQGLSDTFVKNVGSTESKGFEVNLGIKPVNTDRMTLQINGNIAYNYTEVTDLDGVSTINAAESRLPIQTGLFLANHTVGQQPYSAWVFEQLYGADGQPIIGSYVDRNGDNQINDNDRYYQALRPNWTYGFSLSFNYKNWDFSTSFRGQIDGRVYNAIKANYGFIDKALPITNNSLTNVLNFYSGDANPDIQNLANSQIIFSDYFLENAAFLRCENIVLGYKFNKFYKKSSLRLYGAVTNPFLIDDYSGQDPENFNSIDNNFYPRPTTYTVGLSLDF